MAIRDYDAFAGLHAAPGSGFFHVYFADGAACRQFNGSAGFPPGHAERRNSGWYWGPAFPDTPLEPVSLPSIHGPFSSSRKAYQDGMAKLAKGKVAA